MREAQPHLPISQPAHSPEESRELSRLFPNQLLIQERLERANGWNETQGPSEAMKQYRSELSEASVYIQIEQDENWRKAFDPSVNSLEFVWDFSSKPA